MKAITEEILRYELRNSQPDVYVVPAGAILTPAAKEYLQQRKIKYQMKSNFRDQVTAGGADHGKTESAGAAPQQDAKAPAAAKPEPAALPRPKYKDHETGAFYYEKPEQMTQLYGNELVNKDDPRIVFRGKLDSTQSLVVLAQAVIHENGCQALVEDLNDILRHLRELMRCDVLAEDVPEMTTIGLSHAELRERSHDPMKFYKIKQMLLPDYTMGINYAYLNQIRTQIRETELSACTAFKEGGKYKRRDIIEELNRLSSALHIMMCKYLAGDYTGGGN
ncbi:MAG: ATP-binding protein [Lachnospiraceae bacterium]|jgi:ethanolamine utilization cobalamin adenosyltransferase|nr:ATP-binding protein [Lachnospiraceae bacterium]MCI1328769.1 ATP-binding protein [Lachnospiraceae bacterium]